VNAYVDQNFLINCANQSSIRDAATKAVTTGNISFVLSPWHFYEIGTIAPARQTELLSVVKDLKPQWILERYDLELGEFKQEWGKFWGTAYQPVVPIGTLADAAAALLRTTPASLQGAELDRYIAVFSRLGEANIGPELDQQQCIAAANQVTYREGKLTGYVRQGIARNYIAQQLANERMTISSHEEHQAQLAAVLDDKLLVQQIAFFVDGGGMRDLRAWWVESILTDEHHAGTAVLNVNRQIDRQHTIPALAYCDRFVTNDKEVLKRCVTVNKTAGFRVAESMTAEELVASL
jgi:hypothetical protein